MSGLSHRYLQIQVLSLVIILAAGYKAEFSESGAQIYSSNLANKCQSIVCNFTQCKPGYIRKQIDIFCCPTCLCAPCDYIDLNSLCQNGFKPVLNTNLTNECCESYLCISDNQSDDLYLEISSDTDVLNKGIEKANQTVTKMSIDNLMCSSIDCNNKNLKYNESKCPFDSVEVKTTYLEKVCCNAQRKCICNECSVKHDINKWCKEAGNGFKANLVEKAKKVPGQCCDIHICETSNSTCHFNGKFYSHGNEWNIDKCTKCKCELGFIRCKETKCPYLDCEVKQFVTGQCCPICTGQCANSLSKYKYHQQNDVWFEGNDYCIECKCLNGKTSCITESCGMACDNPIKKKGICCPICSALNQTIESHDLINNFTLNNTTIELVSTKSLYSLLILVIIVISTAVVLSFIFVMRSQKNENRCLDLNSKFRNNLMRRSEKSYKISNNSLTNESFKSDLHFHKQNKLIDGKSMTSEGTFQSRTDETSHSNQEISLLSDYKYEPKNIEIDLSSHENDKNNDQRKFGQICYL